MVLYTASQSLILFGIEEISTNYLICEVVLFSEGLSDAVTLINKESGDKFRVLVPKQIQKALLPGIVENLTFIKL
jgi:hypothetical protein